MRARVAIDSNEWPANPDATASPVNPSVMMFAFRPTMKQGQRHVQRPARTGTGPSQPSATLQIGPELLACDRYGSHDKQAGVHAKMDALHPGVSSKHPQRPVVHWPVGTPIMSAM